MAVRQAKLQGLRDSGNDPFGANWEQSHVSQQAVELLSGEEEIYPKCLWQYRGISINGQGCLSRCSTARLVSRHMSAGMKSGMRNMLPSKN